MKSIALLFALSWFAVTAFAADVAGSQDHPLLKRIDGSEILHYTRKGFDGFTIPLQPIVFDYTAQKITPWRKLEVEGARTTLFYREPKDASTLECIRGYQADLAAKRFQPLFEGTSSGQPTGAKNTLDNGFGRFMKEVYHSETDFGLQSYTMPAAEDFRYLALKRSADGASGDVYVTVFCSAVTSGWQDSSKGIAVGTVLARIDVIETKDMDDRMVSVKADDMDKQIAATGRVALYGIYFDTSKSEVKPESDVTLQEIAKLAKSRANVRLLVVGHTDNVGGFDPNKALSERRAAAVVAALTTRYGVDAKSLSAVGVAFASPVAPNTSDEGRAKNRRVELVAF